MRYSDEECAQKTAVLGALAGVLRGAAGVVPRLLGGTSMGSAPSRAIHAANVASSVTAPRKRPSAMSATPAVTPTTQAPPPPPAKRV